MWAATGRRGGYLFSVEPCTEAKALEILSDPSVAKHLNFKPEGFKDSWLYLIDSRCLLVGIEHGEIIEVHMACKYRDRANLRGYLKRMVIFFRVVGFKEIFTIASDERKALVAMIKSLGFQKDNDRWVYRWA